MYERAQSYGRELAPKPLSQRAATDSQKPLLEQPSCPRSPCANRVPIENVKLICFTNIRSALGPYRGCGCSRSQLALRGGRLVLCARLSVLLTGDFPDLSICVCVCVQAVLSFSPLSFPFRTRVKSHQSFHSMFLGGSVLGYVTAERTILKSM